MATRSPRGRDSRGGRPTGRPAPGGRAGRSSGAAAKRPAKKASAATNGSTAGSGPQITSRAVILLTVVLLLLGSYTATFRAWWGAQQELQATRAERAALKRDIAELEDQKVRFDDPAYIKQQARERFGWVMPGEVGYRVIGSDGEVRGEVPTLDAPTETALPQWYDKLWGSVEKAGSKKADAAPAPDTTGDVLKDDR